MPAAFFIISEQNIHQFINFNFESLLPKNTSIPETGSSPLPRVQELHTVIFELYTSQNDMVPASQATFVNDIRSMVESFCNRFRRFSEEHRRPTHF